MMTRMINVWGKHSLHHPTSSLLDCWHKTGWLQWFNAVDSRLWRINLHSSDYVFQSATVQCWWVCVTVSSLTGVQPDVVSAAVDHPPQGWMCCSLPLPFLNIARSGIFLHFPWILREKFLDLNEKSSGMFRGLIFMIVCHLVQSQKRIWIWWIWIVVSQL